MLFRSTERKITKIAREAEKLVLLTMREEGVGTAEIDLINAVRHHPGCTQAQLAELLHADKAAIARRTKNLEAKTGAADSLWYKDHGTEELISVIRRTLAGEKVFPDTSPAIEMEGTMSDTFSPRQLDILRLYIKGFTYQEIADKLGISKNGVRWNLDDMVEKGGFENREALVVTAIENKLMVTTLKDE